MFIKPIVKEAVYKHDGTELKKSGEEITDEYSVFYNRLKGAGLVEVNEKKPVVEKVEELPKEEKKSVVEKVEELPKEEKKSVVEKTKN